MDIHESERLAQRIISGEGQQLITYPSPDFEARIVEIDEKVHLYWHDYIANYWVESFDKVSHAIARLAVLDEAIRNELYTSSLPVYFARDFDSFLKTQLSYPSESTTREYEGTVKDLRCPRCEMTQDGSGVIVDFADGSREICWECHACGATEIGTRLDPSDDDDI
jgi:hypothetical protein